MLWVLLFFISQAYACDDDSGCGVGEICGSNGCCEERSGFHMCSQCYAGTYDHDSDPKTECIQCPAGFYQDGTGKTSCKLCASGKQSTSGQTLCQDIDYCSVQTDMLPKVLHKCANGTCVTAGSGYTCTCNEGWSGEYCHEREECALSEVWNDECTACDKYPFGNSKCLNGTACGVNPCNGGLCSDLITSYECVCPSGRYGSMCQLTEGVACKNGTVVNGVCDCDSKYYGQMCEYNSLCPDGSHITDSGCLDISVCNGEASLTSPCLCGNVILTDGYCHNNEYKETCVLGARGCYFNGEICTFFNGVECVDYLYPGCKNPLYKEYSEDSENATLSTCATPKYGSFSVGDRSCVTNTDCEFGCILGYCGSLECSAGFYWDGTSCEEYSTCDPGTGDTPTGYADVDCKPCENDEWTSGYTCTKFSDMSECKAPNNYWEQGNSSMDHTCYDLIGCEQTNFVTEVQVGTECEPCDGYSARDSETNKEICTPFTDCLHEQYATRTSAIEDVTCVDRTPCDGEEIRMTSRFADSFCLGSNVPDCVKDGVENEHVNVQAKKDLINKGWITKENAIIAMIYCEDGTEFMYGPNSAFTVKLVKGDLNLNHKHTLVAYYRNASVDKVTPNEIVASCTDQGVCIDAFLEHPIGCLHGEVGETDCTNCIAGVSGERCDQVASCDACDFGSCTGDIFDCSCYEGAEEFFCTNIDDCGSCIHGNCIDGNGTYTCDCASYATLVENSGGDYCRFNCDKCVHCSYCNDNGYLCSSGWSGVLCDSCPTGHEIDGDSCDSCDAGEFDDDSDSTTPCIDCPEGETSIQGSTSCRPLECVHSSSSDKTGCTCLEGWTGLNCDTCTDGESVRLSGGHWGICDGNSFICPLWKTGDNCDQCSGSTCNPILERLKDIVDADVEEAGVSVTYSSNSRSQAWGRGSSPKVIRQRKKDMLTRFLNSESDIVLTPYGRELTGICSMSLRDDCASTSRDIKLLPVRRFSTKDQQRCDVTLSEYSIVFGLVADGDEMTVCDSGGNILFHQKLVDSEEEEYEISFFNERFKSAHRYVGGDTFEFRGISFTVANLEAVSIVDPCTGHPCTDLETCQSSGEAYECVKGCDLGYCENEATCVNEAQGDFKCECTDGFEGSLCETAMSACTNHECVHGTCKDEIVDYSCICATGYDGEHCEININDCTDTPCNGNGICVDGIDSFSCECYAGYKSGVCDSETIECTPTSCLNDGQCNEGNQSFTCECALGFNGTNCHNNINDCTDTSCSGHGTCNDGVNSFTCTCTGGYTDNSDGLCAEPPDLCHYPVDVNCVRGSCAEGKCQCPDGWVGADCNTDKVDCPTVDCGHGSCREEPGSYVCDCENGWYTDADAEDTKKCSLNPTDCPANACEYGTCNDLDDDYICDCKDGFSTHSDGHSCVCGLGKGYNSSSGLCETCRIPGYNLEYTQVTPCIDQECDDGEGVVLEDWTASAVGACESCPSGWTSPKGNTPCVNRNECEEYDSPCGGHGACDDTIGSYTCDCEAGYTGLHCIGIDYCHNNPCKNGAPCNNKDEGPDCQCTAGWEGSVCDESVDECENHNCVHGSCKDEHLDFKCECYPGWEGERCQTNKDDCLSHKCVSGECKDTNGTYWCNCTDGYMGTYCNQQCNSDTCKHGACINDKCECYLGWGGNDCNTEINKCDTNPCVYGECTPTNNSFTCTCVSPFEGATCNECPPGFGWDGTTCSECLPGTKNDLSTLSPCVNHTCHSGFGVDLSDWSFQDRKEGACIECEDGYESPEGHGVCENIDECQERPNPCSGQGSCEDTLGGWKCYCNEGFLGERCAIDEDSCEGNPCGGGECVDKDGYYECICENGFAGTTFCVDIDECTPRGETIVLSVSDGKYIINGESAPVLTLKQGETYSFIYPSDHPFQVLHSGSQIGHVKSGNVYELTVTDLSGVSYGCALHSGMGNTIEIVPFLCHNGAGCVNTHGDYYCTCPADYVGKDCDIHLETFCTTASARDYIDYQCCDLPTC